MIDSYNTDNCSTSNGRAGELGCPVECNVDYLGTTVITCNTDDGIFVLSGCTYTPTATATTVAFTMLDPSSESMKAFMIMSVEDVTPWVSSGSLMK